ncbi:MAG: hydrogenase 3 maturation endopeptidase HyCI [Candidatus Omnitrophica bacterium]|nr:hydrogenase 3 maturation endopeptidase HyCI [Candidatus Omnitrophota bacterium]
MNNIFRNVFKGKVVIVGVGNIMRGDDAFGPKFIETVYQKVDATCIDVGSAPENYIGKITKERPNTILIVDVVDLGKEPGDYEILVKEDIVKSGFTTHDLSPRMFLDFLGKETEADIFLLGVQPKTLEFGDEISQSVAKTLKELTNLIIEVKTCTKPIS